MCVLYAFINGPCTLYCDDIRDRDFWEKDKLRATCKNLAKLDYNYN